MFVGDADHLAVGRVALDDLRVVLDADRRRQVEDQLAEEGEPADLLEPAAPVELVRDGDLVDRLVALPERQAGLVGPAVGSRGRSRDGCRIGATL